MTDLVLHEAVEEAARRWIAHPPHALLLSGPAGSGRGALAAQIAAGWLGLTRAELDTYPYVIRHEPIGDTFGIDQVRQLQKFLVLTVPVARPISRVVIAENVQRMPAEAQNAFLKTLEEPPANTAILLTTTSEAALLPTVRSRCQLFVTRLPDAAAMRQHFVARGYAADAVEAAMRMSGGLPGLCAAILDRDAAHPLHEAAALARQLLQEQRFDRLATVDKLSKQRPLLLDVLYILQRMAQMSIMTTASPEAARRWQSIMEAAYAAETRLMRNVQPKLLLTELMLSL